LGSESLSGISNEKAGKTQKGNTCGGTGGGEKSGFILEKVRCLAEVAKESQTAKNPSYGGFCVQRVESENGVGGSEGDLGGGVKGGKSQNAYKV